MDNKYGIIKKIDKLGRIVIPKSIRDRLSLDECAELILTEEGLLLRRPKEDNASAKRK